MRPERALVAAIVLLCIVGAAPRQTELPQLLDTLARVAGMYRDNALSFTCVERITDTRYRSQNRIQRRETHAFDYFYVYNDPDAPDGAAAPGLQDYRTGRDPSRFGFEPERVDLDSVGLAAHLQRAYSWIFVFQPGLRDRHDFVLEGRERALGRDAFVVRFEPRAPYQSNLNEWFGRAWIDTEHYQLLRVEAVVSGDLVRALRGPAPTGPATVLFTHARVEFGEEKNRLRFPSSATVVGTLRRLETVSDAAYREVVAELLDRGVVMDRLFRVQHQYSDYRFFSVRTATEIDTTIRGIRQQ